MCGRFTLRTPANVLMEQFQLTLPIELTPRYNIAPTQPVLAVRVDGRTHAREGVFLHWGLIPSWSKDTNIAARMINARCETVATKPTFRSAFRRRRCLILADGYYEWEKTGTKKQPYHIHMEGERAFAMAGLWESWHGAKNGKQRTIQSCTVITTSANRETGKIHDRMPVILDNTNWDAWLDPHYESRDHLQSMLVPFSSAVLASDPVSTYVNNSRHEGSRCLDKQEELF